MVKVVQNIPRMLVYLPSQLSVCSQVLSLFWKETHIETRTKQHVLERLELQLSCCSLVCVCVGNFRGVFCFVFLAWHATKRVSICLLSLQLNQSRSGVAGSMEVLSGRRRLWALGELAAIESGYRQTVELKHSYPQVFLRAHYACNIYILCSMYV